MPFGQKWLGRLDGVLWALRVPADIPPFVAGLVRALALGSAFLGTVYFAAFFAGTSLYLLPLALASPFLSQKRLRFIGAVSGALAGLWFTASGIFGLLSR
jgi:sulfite exporter TauE/SafE